MTVRHENARDLLCGFFCSEPVERLRDEDRLDGVIVKRKRFRNA
jgi:hypothetical protein